MRIRPNRFKQSLLQKKRQIGAWLSSGSPTVTEIFAGAGYDWLLIDMEHAPNDINEVIAHLRAAATDDAEVIVRVPTNEPIMVKRLLDAGVRSLMFPFVQSAEEAAAAVAATRYPPHGIRGVAGTSRATDYGRKVGFATAAEQIAVVVQIESPVAMNAISDIAAVEGVDGVFIGPNDLAATMGYLGNAVHAEVRAAMLDGAAAIHAAGKASGTLSYVPFTAKSPFHDGFDFVGVVSDTGLLARGAGDAQAEYAKLRELD